MPEHAPGIVAILVSVAALGLVLFVVLTMTSFVKISVILFILRNAIGVQQTPPNLVLYGVALLLTGYIMTPVIETAYAALAVPAQHYGSIADWTIAAQHAIEPLRRFMLRFTHPGEQTFFMAATRRVWGAQAFSAITAHDLIIVLPAFLVSELQRAFADGFLLYLPFIAIDLVVTAVLMAMGMSAVSPTTISVPFKLFLFVAIAGWTTLVHGLVLSYAR